MSKYLNPVRWKTKTLNLPSMLNQRLGTSPSRDMAICSSSLFDRSRRETMVCMPLENIFTSGQTLLLCTYQSTAMPPRGDVRGIGIVPRLVVAQAVAISSRQKQRCSLARTWEGLVLYSAPHSQLFRAGRITTAHCLYNLRERSCSYKRFLLLDFPKLVHGLRDGCANQNAPTVTMIR